MVARMKTTIELPDALAREAKQVAFAQGTTLRELIEAALRAELGRRTERSELPAFRLTTVKGSGLQPGVDRESLREMAYDAT